MCTCISYNRPDLCAPDGQPSVILKAPWWSSRGTICVDACIADAIKMLWDNGIITLGSCCGHNGAFGHDAPSVVIEQGQDALRTLNLLVQFDGRHWEVMEWKLMKVTRDCREWRSNK